MKSKIYTISTAHIDTSWLWTQKETIQFYIPRTLNENFELFEKYPFYKFNFEGSYRYELIKEYYPELFEKLKEYVKKDRWNLTGSCFENGDTNVPSPEALIRNILYGNSFFKENFDKKSNDIFLPDCFGFGRALPQVMSHCGLYGFSTQKLSWGCSIEPPFEIGKWMALDGSFVYTSIKAGNYSNKLKEVRCDWSNDKLVDNINKGNIPLSMTYYGTGDRGGSPYPGAIETIKREIEDNKNNEIEVISGSVVDFFDEVKELDLKQGNLRKFDKEFLMTAHGVGSYTSRAASKRLNKKCENLLDVSERANSLASILGFKMYPQNQFDFDWKRVLEHHFHDDITGTSFTKCYKKNWNDYYLALNNAKDEYISSIALIEKNFDTSKLNNPILVFNPNQDEDSSIISLDIDLDYTNALVVDLDGVEYPTYYKEGKLYFNALLKGNTLKVFDVKQGNSNIDSVLSISKEIIENDRYKVSLNSNLDICSIFDKKLNKELLNEPITYDLIHDVDSIQWPSWEIKYSDIIRKPYGMFKLENATIIEDNPLIVSIQINKVFNKSTLKEIITLQKDSNRIEVYNEINWLEQSTLLKVTFNTTMSNKEGTYDIGISKYNRGNNTELLYEVPAQKFAKIEDGNVGITILSDCKQGFDKPTDNIIRLTAIHTPWSNYRYECSQHLLEYGLNVFSYAITSSNVNEDNSISEAEKFTKPINAFKMSKHEGSIDKDLTLFSLSNNDVRVMCFKKALNTNKYILRVVDYYGKSPKNIKVDFIKNIKSIQLVRGDEQCISELSSTNNTFNFDLKAHEIKSFMIEFEDSNINEEYKYATLPFDKVGITCNKCRNKATLKNKVSIPKELIDNPIIYYKAIKYQLNFDKPNALEFNNQEIKLDRNYKYAYLLILNQGKDKKVLINNKEVLVQNSFDYIGRWDLYALKELAHIKELSQAFTFTHYHKGSKDVIIEDLYLYSIKIKIDSDTLLLNKNNDLSLFAITFTNIDNDIYCYNELVDKINDKKFNYHFTKEEYKYLKEPFEEKIKDIFIDRRKTKYVDWWGGHCYQSPSDFYQMKTEKKNFERRKKIKID